MQPQQPLLPGQTSVASASAAAASAASAADAAPASASKQTNAPSSLSSNPADPTDPPANLQTLYSSAATRASRGKPCPANEKITRRPSLSNRTPRHPHIQSSLHSKATLQSRHGACARRPATCSTHTLAARAPPAPPARDYTAYRKRRGEGGAVNVKKPENNYNNLLFVGARVETSVVTPSVHGRGGKRGGDRDVERVDRKGVVLRVMGDRCLIRWDRLPPSQSVTTPPSMSSRHASDTTSRKTSSKSNNKAKGSTNSTSSNKSTAPIWGVKGVGLLQERECVLLMRLGALRPVVNMVQREGDGDSGRRGCVATGGNSLSLSVLIPLYMCPHYCICVLIPYVSSYPI
jgi:hypothetical protein